jgi:spore coat protein CotH
MQRSDNDVKDSLPKSIDEVRFEDTRVYRELREETTRTIALNLLREGMSLETTARVTDLTIAQLHQLQAGNQG